MQPLQLSMDLVLMKTYLNLYKILYNIQREVDDFIEQIIHEMSVFFTSFSTDVRTVSI